MCGAIAGWLQARAREACFALDLPDAQVQPAEVGAEQDAGHRLDASPQYQAAQQLQQHINANQVLRSAWRSTLERGGLGWQSRRFQD